MWLEKTMLLQYYYHQFIEDILMNLEILKTVLFITLFSCSKGVGFLILDIEHLKIIEDYPKNVLNL